MKSMTGYGYSEYQDERIKCSLELKSYNGRYLDIAVNLPPSYGAYESRIRSWIAARATRGSVEVSLRLKELGAAGAVSVDYDAAKQAFSALRKLKRECGIPGKPALADILSIEGILKLDRESDREGTWKIVEGMLGKCFQDFEKARIEEGKATERDILSQLGRIETSLALIRGRAGEIESTIKDNLKKRFAELLGSGIDENRVLAETAVLLVKYTVNEEIERAGAHLSSFRKIAAEDPSPGKKLDFLSQELNREFNTIGSKSLIVDINHEVVVVKDAIECIREQLRNVE